VSDLRELLHARHGHFRLESGHHGDLFLDLDAAFWDPAALAPLVRDLAGRLRPHRPDVVVGPLAGGAILAHAVAADLGTRFAAAERHAHDPGGLYSALYSAQYRLPPSVVPRLRGRRVAVVDDVVNAGSAVRSTLAAVAAAGGDPVATGALLRLGDTALRHPEIARRPLEVLDAWPNTVWEPAACPLCAAGVPLEAAQP
jgi:orotate phosphoribosyltransferase